jgi:hypothetical protein
MSSNKEDSKITKKSYQSPTLKVYGDLHEITKSAGASPGGKHTDTRNPFFPDTRTH